MQTIYAVGVHEFIGNNHLLPKLFRCYLVAVTLYSEIAFAKIGARTREKNMTFRVAKVGQVVKATRDILLTRNTHVTVLSSASVLILRKGTEAEVTAVAQQHIELNCKDGHGNGIAAWGLQIRIAKVVWGTSFE